MHRCNIIRSSRVIPIVILDTFSRFSCVRINNTWRVGVTRLGGVLVKNNRQRFFYNSLEKNFKNLLSKYEKLLFDTIFSKLIIAGLFSSYFKI